MWMSGIENRDNLKKPYLLLTRGNDPTERLYVPVDDTDSMANKPEHFEIRSIGKDVENLMKDMRYDVTLQGLLLEIENSALSTVDRCQVEKLQFSILKVHSELYIREMRKIFSVVEINDVEIKSNVQILWDYALQMELKSHLTDFERFDCSWNGYESHSAIEEANQVPAATILILQKYEIQIVKLITRRLEMSRDAVA